MLFVLSEMCATLSITECALSCFSIYALSDKFQFAALLTEKWAALSVVKRNVGYFCVKFGSGLWSLPELQFKGLIPNPFSSRCTPCRNGLSLDK